MTPERDVQSNFDAEWTFRFSPDEADQPTIAIVNALAWLKGVHHRELTPLSMVIDAEALNDLVTARPHRHIFGQSSEGSERGRPLFTFEYEDCVVNVHPERISIETETA